MYTYDYYESSTDGFILHSTTESLYGTGSLMNVTGLYNETSVCEKIIRPGRMFGVVVKVVYAIGIFGNAAAIVALRRGERRVRNRKHLLLLTSLAANDLVALVRTTRAYSIYT